MSFAIEIYRVQLLYEDADGHVHATTEEFSNQDAARDADKHAADLRRQSWPRRARRWIITIERATGWATAPKRITPNRTWRPVHTFGDWTIRTPEPAADVDQLELGASA